MENNSDLYEWMTPDEACSKATTLLPKGVALWSGANKHLRELWVMAHFAVGYELLNSQDVVIRLSEEEPADAQMRIGGQVIDYQLCETLRKGRERHREYKEMGKANEIEFKDYAPLSCEESEEWLVVCIKKKDSRCYSSDRKLNLLVYVDFDYKGLDLQKIAVRLEAEDIKSFKEIWLYSACWAKVGNGSIVGMAWPNPNGFLPYVARDKRVISKDELAEPFIGWKYSVGDQASE